MQHQHIGYRTKALPHSLACLGQLWERTSKQAQECLKTLGFFADHGAAAACSLSLIPIPASLSPSPPPRPGPSHQAAIALDALCQRLPKPPRFRIEDNGSEFMGRFQQHLDAHGMTHWRTYPKSPTILPGEKWRVVREADSYQG